MEQYITTTNGSDVRRVEFVLTDEEAARLPQSEVQTRRLELNRIAQAALQRGLAVHTYRDARRYAYVVAVARQMEEL